MKIVLSLLHILFPCVGVLDTYTQYVLESLPYVVGGVSWYCGAFYNTLYDVDRRSDKTMQNYAGR